MGYAPPAFRGTRDVPGRASTMAEDKSREVEHALAGRAVHDKWESAYRTVENEAFFERAFEYIVEAVHAGRDAEFLDAGCGIAAHSIRLARRGFRVQAVDFSESVLKLAKANVLQQRLEDRINIRRDNLLALSFKDASFDYVLCWGVLMHVPDVKRAVSELSRVLRPGGILILSEGNMHSLQAIALRMLRRATTRRKTEVVRTEAGVEYWAQTPTGRVLTREANVSWLIERFRNHRMVLRRQMAGQFTEIYTRVSSPLLRRAIHSFNAFYFRYVKIPHVALGNILIFQKENSRARGQRSASTGSVVDEVPHRDGGENVIK
jgi:2-polyprenyl-3-methyl-5-hydroxy-6-metoxy-1,4-benzoquinol methylase